MFKFRGFSQLGQLEHVHVHAAAPGFIQARINGGNLARRDFMPCRIDCHAAASGEFFDCYKWRIYMKNNTHLVPSTVAPPLIGAYGDSLRKFVYADKHSTHSSVCKYAHGDLMHITERIRFVREAEKLSQSEFAAEVGVNIGTLRNWEQGRSNGIGSKELEKITTHDRFTKYALWLVTGKAAPEAGQISPEIEQARLSETG